MFDLADIVVLWTLRISILSLTILAFIYCTRKRNKISAVILVGMIFISIGEATNYFANLVLTQEESLKESFKTFKKITSITGYLIIFGYFFAVTGCYLSVLKKKA